VSHLARLPSAPAEKAGLRLHVTGVVQGVGFRPFVYALAERLGLLGWVRNTSAGVDIEVTGTEAALAEFARALRSEAPPLARIDEVQAQACEPQPFTTFEIIASQGIAEAFQPISPDVSICPDCLRELFDPADRRYRYPFINCTNCGPRFTLITDIPYDRPNTTMAAFPLCPDCAREYADPRDRRFNAQPVACPACGPAIWLEVKGDKSPSDPLLPTSFFLEGARALLVEGKILAVKGLGGFHLACDATNASAVAELRRRKLRVDKPFAVMMPDLAAVEAHCLVDGAERTLLETRERPIVVLRRRPGSAVAAEVTPGQDTLGVMLPYTPLHYLLLERAAGFPEALVMTSGNVSEEPIATDNEEARQRLATLADAFLMHNRDIRTRCDDSVVRVVTPLRAGPDPAPHASSLAFPVRRSRGYAPAPIRLPRPVPSLLAAGAELKNTFCLTRDRYAFLSHHIGDLENYETLQSYEDGLQHFERLFRIRPEAVAYDLHPDYLATRYALERAERQHLPSVCVQHHHAHIAACMAEHGLTGEGQVIGVAFDGTGYGDDGAIWGGEFLLADYAGYTRAFHLAYVPLPGGDRAVREPWRVALAWLSHAGVGWEDDLPPVSAASAQARAAVERLLVSPATPLTSSMGRLFDAVAALAGGRAAVNYEAQAAIELEAQVDPDEAAAYVFELESRPPSVDGAPTSGVVDASPVIRAVVADLRRGVRLSGIAARFHNGVAQMVRQVCAAMRRQSGAREVALSGGVWQNVALLRRTIRLLEADGFTVYVHRQVPPNDGGVALGQAVVAAAKLNG
jgi:hydrogenase maturation protein HypF